MRNIRVYGFSACPYCAKAKKLLEKQNIPFEYHDIPTPEERKDWMDFMSFKGKDRTFPRIFGLDGELIGGYTELEDMVVLYPDRLVDTVPSDGQMYAEASKDNVPDEVIDEIINDRLKSAQMNFIEGIGDALAKNDHYSRPVDWADSCSKDGCEVGEKDTSST